MMDNMKYVNVAPRRAFWTMLCVSATLLMSAQAPALKHVFDIHAECAPALVSGDVPHGKRVMIPITGGYVDGGITASILPGGADYQLVDESDGRVEYKAVYTFMTADSVLVNVTNEGVSRQNDEGFYFTTTPKFEVGRESAYDWLNNHVFVCRPIGFDNGCVHLRVWKVE